METREGLTCIKVSFQGRDIPYFAYGRAHVRVADEDRQLRAKESENLILAGNRGSMRRDNETGASSLDSPDIDKLKCFVERAGLIRDNPANVPEKLGLIQEGKPLNVFVLFLLDSRGRHA